MKYKNKKTIVAGTGFDSKKEAKRYMELLTFLKYKKIKELELQPKFELQPAYKKNSKTIRAITYIADFKYFDVDKKKYVVEDVKGFKTEVYKLKKKLFEFKFDNLEVIEI